MRQSKVVGFEVEEARKLLALGLRAQITAPSDLLHDELDLHLARHSISASDVTRLMELSVLRGYQLGLGVSS
jgi:hypothetical protein